MNPSIISRLKEYLKTQPVQKVWVFGSEGTLMPFAVQSADNDKILIYERNS